jgi:hypothetical protein
MADDLVCELNLVIAPETTLAVSHIAISNELAGRHPARIALNGFEPRLAFAPHVTLYQVAIRLSDMETTCEQLAKIAAHIAPVTLRAAEYAYHAEDATIELRYEATEPLLHLQHEVLETVNPIRGDLLRERDPSGHLLAELAQESGAVSDNIRATGFDAVGDPATGGTFIPHVSLDWFEPGTAVDLDRESLPPTSHFDGRFVSLGIHFLGPYGTCSQRLASLPLRG